MVQQRQEPLYLLAYHPEKGSGIIARYAQDNSSLLDVFYAQYSNGVNRKDIACDEALLDFDDKMKYIEEDATQEAISLGKKTTNRRYNAFCLINHCLIIFSHLDR